jgi:hypothetical protein
MRLANRIVVLALLCASGLVGMARAADAPPPEKFHLWLYTFGLDTSLANEESTAKMLATIERIKKAGYTGLAFQSNKMHRVSEQTPEYLANVKKVREACTKAGIDLVATCLPLGYANDIMIADPNLAEAVPIVDAPYVIKDGKIVPDDPTNLVNGDFSNNKDNKPAGWNVDVPGKGLFVDTEVKYNGKPSLRMEDIQKNGEGSHMRANQQIKVKPFQNYHLSVAIKTENYTGQDNRLMGYTGDGHVLNVFEFDGIAPTQDWKVYDKIVNTMDYDNVTIYIGSWDGRTGKIWFADVKMEPAGLSNMVRRPGAPFKATSADGKTVYVEGKDIPEMKDPGTGHSPYRGGYQWHKGPELALPSGSSLKEGDKLLLSYSAVQVMCYGDQVPICMSEPKSDELINTVIQNIAKTMQPDYWFLEHDEIRMAGWSKSDNGKTPGQIIAENIGKCYAMIRKAEPTAKGVFVWSDMFDAYHNAGHVNEFYAVCRGKNPWDKSWLGLPKEMGVINWNAGKPESVKFFSTEGHAQIISGCDPSTVANILKSSTGQKGVTGAIYVTWSNDFSNNVEHYADAILKWKKSQDVK